MRVINLHEVAVDQRECGNVKGFLRREDFRQFA